MNVRFSHPWGVVAFCAVGAGAACGRVGDSSPAAAGGSTSVGGAPVFAGAPPAAQGSSAGAGAPPNPSGGVSESGRAGAGQVASGGTTPGGGGDSRGGASGGASGATSAGGALANGGFANGGQGGGGSGGGCADIPATCGPSASSDCCLSNAIPGGTFKRANDAAIPATVANFRLDTYEVTVGRFRKFVDAYPANRPAAGSGKNPNNPADPGWDATWPLPVDQASLLRALSCKEANQVWTDAPGDSENFPMNCLSWYEAFAFCIWDGGRLPTEAEWNYAAAGGAEQRVYPWSSPPESRVVNAGRAFFGMGIHVKPIRVGSKSPQGDGKWGSSDLAGNLWEWTRDALRAYPTPCDNCSIEPDGEPYRIIRGGGIYNSGPDLQTPIRSIGWAASHFGDIGARCARDP